MGDDSGASRNDYNKYQYITMEGDAAYFSPKSLPLTVVSEGRYVLST